jgi:hypothetical protein
LQRRDRDVEKEKYPGQRRKREKQQLKAQDVRAEPFPLDSWETSSLREFV